MKRPAAIAFLTLVTTLVIGIMSQGSVLQVPSGTWSPAASLSEVRDAAATARLSDGRILVIDFSFGLK